MENYSLHGATQPKVNTHSLDGSRKSGGAMPSNSKCGGAMPSNSKSGGAMPSNSKSGGVKAPPAPPSVPPLLIGF